MVHPRDGVYFMRVIAGAARGRGLVAPAGDRVRPTLDRVREALFNILGPEIAGRRFLDLFAGSGANGIEALSRGVEAAVFVDDHPQSLSCIQKNLAATGFSGRGRCMRYRLPAELSKVTGEFDTIFADPPHDFGEYEALIAGIETAHLLREGGLIVIEHSRKLRLADRIGRYSRTQERHYGMTTLTFYA